MGSAARWLNPHRIASYVVVLFALGHTFGAHSTGELAYSFTTPTVFSCAIAAVLGVAAVKSRSATAAPVFIPLAENDRSAG